MGRATLQGQLHPRRAPLELPVQQQELRSGLVRVIWNCSATRVSFTLPSRHCLRRWVFLRFSLPNHEMDVQFLQAMQMDCRFMLLLRRSCRCHTLRRSTRGLVRCIV